MKKTYLHAHHIALGAKMGEFAGYDMPLFYADGVLKEHEWVRSHAGVFDVSHMGQLILTGSGIAEFLETLTPSDFVNKTDGRSQYTVLLNEQGGIIDDMIVTRLSHDRFFVVVNAGRKTVDIAWMKSRLPASIQMHYLENHPSIALQGPKSEHVLEEVFNLHLKDLSYMHACEQNDLIISRLGYTGEDGFEISIPEDRISDFWTALCAHTDVKPIGLAARDSLRLDMGYPLYGHDIDESTSPVEAGLEWIIKKSDKIGYNGQRRIEQERNIRPAKARVGIKLNDKGIAREGAPVQNQNGQIIGQLTSGGFSPTLKYAIGQAYIDHAYAQPGTFVLVDVRGKLLAAEVCTIPFLQPKTRSIQKNLLHKGT